MSVSTQRIPHFLPDNAHFSFKNEVRHDCSEKHPFIRPLLAELEVPPLYCHTPCARLSGGPYYKVLLTNPPLSVSSL